MVKQRIQPKVRSVIKINNQYLLIKEFNGQRVVTFREIDMIHQRLEGTTKKNFGNNKFHFIKNVDYYLVNKSEVGEEFSQSLGFDKFAPSGILITESGYLMLVKSLTDDLAWKVQRELGNNYFRVKPKLPQLSKELQAIFVLDERTVELENKVNNIENNMPLFNIECKELQGLVRKIGIKILGGYKSFAYSDNSLRQKVYKDN